MLLASSLTLKVPSKICSRLYSIFSAPPNFFFEKKKKFKMQSAAVLNGTLKVNNKHNFGQDCQIDLAIFA